MILLTPEELAELQFYQEPDNESIGYEKNIAKAQAKKILKWGDELCPHWNSEWHLKHYCPKCWQELQKECE